jgi:amino acid transporter
MALMAYIGTELIGVTVGETENPRRNVPRAIRRMFIRILVFYVGGTFVISLTVPSNSSVCGPVQQEGLFLTLL